MAGIGTLAAGVVAAAGLALAAAPASAAFVLSNSNGGDGFVVLGPAPFILTLYGSDNGAENNGVTFSNVATEARSFVVNFRYHTDDVDGAGLDPAGVFINDEYFQLSPDESEQGFTLYGHFAHDVLPGDVYGLYVDSTDGILGRASLSLGGVPEPASWALMIGGFAMTGTALRRRRAVRAA